MLLLEGISWHFLIAKSAAVRSVKQMAYPSCEGPLKRRDQMKAIVIRQPGGTESLSYEEFPDPEPGPGEVLVRVRAAGVNHLDLFMSRGLAGIEFPIVPGGDVAGEVVTVGPGVIAPHMGIGSSSPQCSPVANVGGAWSARTISARSGDNWAGE